MRKVKVGLAQLSCVGDKEKNIEKFSEKVRELAGMGAQVVVLQELFASLYFCDEERYENFKLAEAIPEGPTTQKFMALAKELGVVLVCSMFEKRAEGLYHNTTAVIDADGSYLGKYRKMHIPDDPGYYEKFYFTPGDLGYKVFETKYCKIGVLICWDQWYPEAARITAMKGAEMLVFPTAIGWDERQREEDNREQYEAWQTIQRSHAVANGVPVVSVNRTGKEGGMQFWGGSFVTNAFGRVLYQAPHLEEALHVEELDLDESDHYRRHWPYFRDRRIDSYGPITKRFIDEEK
ncbi:MAG: carbon-nitrogen hydrolase [Bacteroidales bacterium]|nr:carbon-nitrogen hydrolase [Bacteroidales bacterium]MBQ6742577.1 carbon-nitrogen hydrolase [Bacteroidales bacterium]MBQ6742596.1 carbon-nitrogen hydrolase [Bacteroidales bacterium]